MKNEYAGIRKQFNKYGNVQSLMRYINVQTLTNKHNELEGHKATGIDNITKAQYDANVHMNIYKLIQKLKSFEYIPKPSRRVYIPKTNGKVRPLGIPCYEDKIVQGVMADILNAIYENIFLESSFGYRSNRNCHLALKRLNEAVIIDGINYIIEADIKGFFDNINHELLIQFLEFIIKDKNFIRYINRFIKSGVIDKDNVYFSETGAPQRRTCFTCFS